MACVQMQAFMNPVELQSINKLVMFSSVIMAAIWYERSLLKVCLPRWAACASYWLHEGEISTLAGSQQGFGDENGKAARFHSPDGICFDESSQSLLVCDSSNNKLRRVQLNGTSSPSLSPPSARTPFPFLTIHAGDVSTVCEIEEPTFVAVTANSTILVSTNKNILYKVTRQGIPTELTQHKHSLN